MNTLRLTAKDFTIEKRIRGRVTIVERTYCGKEDVSQFDGNLEIGGYLGLVRFEKLSVTGSLTTKWGTGLAMLPLESDKVTIGGDLYITGNLTGVQEFNVGGNFHAWGFVSVNGIEAGGDIVSEYFMDIRGNIKCGGSLRARDFIFADRGGIEAKKNIVVLNGTLAAVQDIVAGGIIRCKKEIRAGWQRLNGEDIIVDEDAKIICAKLEQGTVKYGNLIETGIVK